MYDELLLNAVGIYNTIAG